MKTVFKNTIVRMSILVVALFCVVMFVSFRLRQNELKLQAEELQAKKDTLIEYIIELQSNLDRPFDDEYVAEIAHQKLGLRYPQEIIYYSGSER